VDFRIITLKKCEEKTLLYNKSMSNEDDDVSVQSGDDIEVPLELKDMRKKKERKPYTMSEEGKKRRLANLAKAKEKLAEKERQKYEALKAKYENVKETKPQQEEPQETQEEEQPVPQPKKVKQTEPKEVAKASYSKNGKKKVKKIIYEEDSDSSSSEEEVIVKRKSKAKRREFSAEELQQLREEEIQRRLKLHEERDEFAKLEKEALKRRYAEKLKEAKLSQFNSYMFPESSWKRR